MRTIHCHGVCAAAPLGLGVGFWRNSLFLWRELKEKEIVLPVPIMAVQCSDEDGGGDTLVVQTMGPTYIILLHVDPEECVLCFAADTCMTPGDVRDMRNRPQIVGVDLAAPPPPAAPNPFVESPYGGARSGALRWMAIPE